MKTILTVLGMAAAIGPLSDTAVAASLGSKSTLTLEVAKRATSIAMTQAHAKGGKIAVSVVDDGGHLIYFERDDGVAYGMADASLRKAQTAASVGFSTRALEDQIMQGHTGYLSLPGALPLEGGIPIVVKGVLIGAIGVAGGNSPDDGVAAKAGAETISAGQ
jgi:glc operon protein GlcG